MSAAAPTVLDAVREDPALTPQEKETTIRFAKDEDEATIYTREAGLIRRLVAHPESDVSFFNVLVDGDARTTTESEWNGAAITGVEVRVPVGALQVKSSSRETTDHAPIVSGRVLNEEGQR